VHDVGAYAQNGAPRPLELDMVLTVEPGLYITADADVPPEYRGIGIRIEDDVLVTPEGNRGGGHRILTEAIPKEVAELEALTAA
jgi:Xaa-Pro aminopeptidase